MRIAIAHDYLTQLGGAERVVLSLLKAFPGAPVYTTIYNPDTTYDEFRDQDVRTTWLNRMPWFRADHRAALPFLAPATSGVRIDADVLIASSSGWAHGFRTTGRKLVYCHTPARWLYRRDEYLGDHHGLLKAGVGAAGPLLRRWDRSAAAGADLYLANSHVTQQRIADMYGFRPRVVFPPHRIDDQGRQEMPPQLSGFGDFHLLVSRLLPYKNVVQAAEAFRAMPEERLVIVGKGPTRNDVLDGASPNVILLEGIPDAQLRWLYAHTVALLAPSYEDFGLTVIEAGAFGAPTYALRTGGYLDTVTPGLNGLFFDVATPDAIADAVRRGRREPLAREAIVERAHQFGEEAFVAAIRRAVDEVALRAN